MFQKLCSLQFVPLFVSSNPVTNGDDLNKFKGVSLLLS